MSVPDFQSLFIPVLKFASDGNEHSLSEMIESLARQLGLSEADRDELLPSGKQRKFDNRVSWARTYLQKALLLVLVQQKFLSTYSTNWDDASKCYPLVS